MAILSCEITGAAPALEGCACCAPALKDMALASFATFAPRRARPRAAAAQPADFILANARILTAGPGFPTVEAMAVQDGRILATGTLEAVRASAKPGTAIFDANGRAVLPGFVEPHLHLMPVAMFSRLPDVGALNCPDGRAVLARIKALAAERAKGEWIVAFKVDPSLQADAHLITRAGLDSVAPDHPVLIFNASLHIAYANSAALAQAGIAETVADPPGAAFGRDQAGRLNGVLQGQAAMGKVSSRTLGVLNIGPLDQAMAKLCAHANSKGLTMLCDQGVGGFGGEGEAAGLLALSGDPKLTARLRLSLFDTRAAAWDRLGLKPGQGDAMARLTGWKIVSDGSNQGRTGLQRQPYLGGGTGLAYVEPQYLKDTVTRRALEGWQVVVHANGDLAIDRALDAFEAAYQAGAPRSARFRIEHCSILHNEQIARMKQLDVSPSFLIGHVHYWAKAFRDDIFGPEKANLLGRAATCAAAGLRVSLHSDDPVSAMGPLRLIDNAVNRNVWREDGAVLNPAERLSVEQAILAVTRDAAWQCGSDHEAGTLEPGKFADFTVLEKDPRQTAAADIGKIAVLETWLGGNRVFSA